MACHSNAERERSRRASWVSRMMEERIGSDQALAMRRYTWQRFEQIARQAIRHLSLSAWETEFIEGLATAGAAHDGELELSDKQLLVLLRLEDRLAIKQLLDQMRGDPQLTAWEEGFLLNLTRQHGGLSEKQLQVLQRIQNKALSSVTSEQRVDAPEASDP
jgi:hypothetical protein